MIPIIRDCEMSENTQPLKKPKKILKKKELKQKDIFITKKSLKK